MKYSEVVMRELTYVCAVLVIIISIFGPADAQNGALIPYQDRGVYSTYGNQTYGPHGLRIDQGNQTYTQGPHGPGPTYSTYGHQTYGSDGSTYTTYGNTTYQNNGTTTQSHGNQIYTYGPGGRTVVCSVYGNPDRSELFGD